MHPSGGVYSWVDESEPWSVSPTEAPAWLGQVERKTERANGGCKVAEGSRNSTLTSLAGLWRREGMAPATLGGATGRERSEVRATVAGRRGAQDRAKCRALRACQHHSAGRRTPARGCLLGRRCQDQHGAALCGSKASSARGRLSSSGARQAPARHSSRWRWSAARLRLPGAGARLVAASSCTSGPNHHVPTSRTASAP